MNSLIAYETLKVTEFSSHEEIKTEYRKLAKTVHPDICKEHNAEEKFKFLNEAFEWLKVNHTQKLKTETKSKGKLFYRFFTMNLDRHYYVYLHPEVLANRYSLQESFVIEDDITIHMMFISPGSNFKEVAMHLDKGTKLPNKFLITNIQPNVTIEILIGSRDINI